MKRTRGLTMLVIALLAGAAAVLLASILMRAQAGGTTKVAVAAADIEIGARLSPEMLKLVEWPPNSVPPGSFSDANGLEGRVVKTSLSRGEPFIEAKLAAVGAKGGLSAVVAEGKRAMTVRVNDVVGVAGFALPGNYVDIMVNTQNEGTKRVDQDKTISKIVLERILVLAVAQEADRDATKPKVVNAVTLEVLPAEAELLDLARSVGTLSLVLRNQIDPKPGATEGATKLSLLKDEPARPASAPTVVVKRVAAQRPAAPLAVRNFECVEVIRGTVKTNECF